MLRTTTYTSYSLRYATAYYLLTTYSSVLLLPGILWLVRNLDIDGIYLDGAPYERSILRRLRRALASEGRGSGARPLATCYDAGARPLHLLAGEWPGATPILTMTPTHYGAGFLLDLHASCAGNPHLPYVELYPYLDSIWFGEQCEYARHAKITSHTVAASAAYGCSPNHLRLQVRRLLTGRVAGRGVGGTLWSAWADPRHQHRPGAGANLNPRPSPNSSPRPNPKPSPNPNPSPYPKQAQGLLFGMTCRIYPDPHRCNPRPLWAALDALGMRTPRLFGWWNASCPVRAHGPTLRYAAAAGGGGGGGGGGTPIAHGGRHGSGPAVLASAYVNEAGRVAVVLANWATHAVTVQPYCTYYGPHILKPAAVTAQRGPRLYSLGTATILITRCG